MTTQPIDTFVIEGAPFGRGTGRGELAHLYAPIAAELREAERVFDDELCSDLPFVSALCDTVRSYRGKMLRPALLLLAGRAVGGTTPAHPVLAAVVEMVHVATLVHDDVLDEAEQRRNRPTVRAVSGNVAAVLLGDFLISHAFHLCSSLDDQHAARRIGATTNVVCAGELLQNRLAAHDEITECAYFEVIERKTGALTATACELGAAYAGADDAGVEAMRAYGLAVGVAFQIVDDVLDIVGDEREVGKTLGKDALLGKATLPVIHCLRHAGGDVAAMVAEAVRDPGHARRLELRRLLEACGSIDYAMSKAHGFVGDALGRLEHLPPTPAKSSLTALGEFIVRRSF